MVGTDVESRNGNGIDAAEGCCDAHKDNQATHFDLQIGDPNCEKSHKSDRARDIVNNKRSEDSSLD